MMLLLNSVPLCVIIFIGHPYPQVISRMCRMVMAFALSNDIYIFRPLSHAILSYQNVSLVDRGNVPIMYRETISQDPFLRVHGLFQVGPVSPLYSLTYTATADVFGYFLEHPGPMEFQRDAGCGFSNSLMASCWQVVVFLDLSSRLRMHCFYSLPGNPSVRSVGSQNFLWSLPHIVKSGAA